MFLGTLVPKQRTTVEIKLFKRPLTIALFDQITRGPEKSFQHVFYHMVSDHPNMCRTMLHLGI